MVYNLSTLARKAELHGDQALVRWCLEHQIMRKKGEKKHSGDDLWGTPNSKEYFYIDIK